MTTGDPEADAALATLFPPFTLGSNISAADLFESSERTHEWFTQHCVSADMPLDQSAAANARTARNAAVGAEASGAIAAYAAVGNVTFANVRERGGLRVCRDAGGHMDDIQQCAVEVL